MQHSEHQYNQSFQFSFKVTCKILVKIVGVLVMGKVHVTIVELGFVAERDGTTTVKAVMDQLAETGIILASP